MKHLLRFAVLALLPALAAAAPVSRADAWWANIAAIADDRTEGRQTGSAGYLRAADYVEARFRALGLRPAGVAGFRQPVAFEEQVVDHAASTAALVDAAGTATPLAVGRDLLIGAAGGPRPATVDAPLVFIGYGLHLPAQGYDDFAGVDLRGKIAVVVSGGPAGIAGPVKAANRSDRIDFLKAAGAVGLISLTTPHQTEIPWDRRILLAGQAGMYLADPALRHTPDGFFTASFDAAASERLFAGSGTSFAAVAALADASSAVTARALPVRLTATIAATRRAVVSPNLVAVIPGADPRLSREYVVVSAHLDHLGIGAPIAGDRIYNGAMDDASGVASVLDIAGRLKAGPQLARSVLILIVTAEEKGLLGSEYFAGHPTVARGAIVADLNFDMPLPLWPLKTVLAQGDGESSLGGVARAVAAGHGLALVADPLPDRNSFTRTDQFSFVRAGVPALAFKFGFAAGAPEFAIEHDWRASRYHSPSDDLAQPGVLRAEAIRLDDYVADVVRRVAADPARPKWNADSVFRPAS